MPFAKLNANLFSTGQNAILSHAKWAVLVFALTYIPLWHKLSAPAIYIWDEASYALNSLEMAIDKDFLVMKANGEPSLYNVKPPLVIWLQCLSIWCFGPGEWAVRFPSALAGLLTCLAVFYFAKRHFGLWAGLFAVLFLATTEGYVRHHLTRTGDLDSVLVFFVTAYSLLFMDFLLASPTELAAKKRLHWIGLLVFCAFMSKSIAGLMPLLGLALGTVVLGKGQLVFANRRVYSIALWVMAGCLSYYAIRGYAQAGYLQKVWFSEYARFTQNIMPWLESPWYYYFVALKTKLYPIYCWALPFTLFLLKNKNKTIRDFYLLGLIYCLVLLLLFSYPSVKLDWYIAPIYPILSLMLACLLSEALLAISSFLNLKKIATALNLIAMLLVFSFPYFQAFKRTENTGIAEPQERAGHAIREISLQHPIIKVYKLFMPVEHPEHCDAALFYIKKLNHQSANNIAMIGDLQAIQVGDTVLCSQRDGRKMLNEQFELDTILSLKHGLLLKIAGQQVQ
jgi:4-amino-4-deoxy-L-arabinose transferase-like glycosyltransferase